MKEAEGLAEKKTSPPRGKPGVCRVVLLNPPTAAPSSEVLLNLAYLSATLKKAGHKVLVIDPNAPFHRLSEKEIKRKILEFRPHFIGVTLTITYIAKTYEYFKRLKKLPFPLVAGGPHANCLPEEVLNHGADIVAIGEGELTILGLAEYFLGKKGLEDIEGICFRNKDGSVHHTPPRPLIRDLDQIPFPDFSAFPISYYTGVDDPNSSSIFWAVFSSRGCPYNCIFCSSHNVFGRTYRARSPENVFQELEKLYHDYGARHFAFQDDEAFINKERVIAFCNLVKESQLNLTFSARLRMDSLDVKMLKVMKGAGFRRLAFGLESFNDESLLKMNKNHTVKELFEGFEALENAGIRTIHYNQLVGFPWETPKHLEDSLEKIAEIPKSIRYFCCTVTLIPYPKTKLYEDYHEKYGFTEWWLDPERNSPVDLHVSKAFFMLFVREYVPLYSNDIFWKHSRRMKRAIHRFCWKVSSMQLRRCLGPIEFPIMFNLSKASHWVWKKSPFVESVLFFAPKMLVKSLKMHEKANFRKY
jgi:radical SAM superfamily enzyme YgiQ (UPF0313 family)